MNTTAKAKAAASQRAYYQRNKERIQAENRLRDKARWARDPSGYRAASRRRTRAWALRKPLDAKWYSYRNHANERGFAFPITKEEFASIAMQPCAWCGTHADESLRGFHGIDRVDNSRGYEVSNCVSCCKWCNRAKDVRSAEDFKRWAVRLGTHILSGQAP